MHWKNITANTILVFNKIRSKNSKGKICSETFRTKWSYIPAQGDQIGRIFAYWTTVCFGHFDDNKRSSNCWATFFHGKSYVLILTKKLIGLHFGRFFLKKSSGNPAPSVLVLLPGRHLPVQRVPGRLHLLHRIIRPRRLPQASGSNLIKNLKARLFQRQKKYFIYIMKRPRLLKRSWTTFCFSSHNLEAGS
jgi:hypothetical protein